MVTKANPLRDSHQVAQFKRKLDQARELCGLAQKLLDEAKGLMSADSVEAALQHAQSAERLLKDGIERFWISKPEKEKVGQ